MSERLLGLCWSQSFSVTSCNEIFRISLPWRQVGCLFSRLSKPSFLSLPSQGKCSWPSWWPSAELSLLYFKFQPTVFTGGLQTGCSIPVAPNRPWLQASDPLSLLANAGQDVVGCLGYQDAKSHLVCLLRSLAPFQQTCSLASLYHCTWLFVPRKHMDIPSLGIASKFFLWSFVRTSLLKQVSFSSWASGRTVLVHGGAAVKALLTFLSSSASRGWVLE